MFSWKSQHFILKYLVLIINNLLIINIIFIFVLKKK